MSNMTIEQALQILEHAASMAPMPKQAHIEVEFALKLIKEKLGC